MSINNLSGTVDLFKTLNTTTSRVDNDLSDLSSIQLPPGSPASATAKIALVQSELQGIKSNIQNGCSTTQTIEDKINEIISIVNQQSSDIATLQSQVATLQSSNSSLQSAVQTAQSTANEAKSSADSATTTANTAKTTADSANSKSSASNTSTSSNNTTSSSNTTPSALQEGAVDNTIYTLPKTNPILSVGSDSVATKS